MYQRTPRQTSSKRNFLGVCIVGIFSKMKKPPLFRGAKRAGCREKPRSPGILQKNKPQIRPVTACDSICNDPLFLLY